MVWRIEHRGCLGTPREIIWPSSSGLALGVGTAVVVIPRVCLCFGHSWFWDVWRVSWRLAVGCILNLSRSTSRSCLSQLPSQSSKLFQTYGKKGETRKYPQRWQPETKRRQKDTNMFFLFENWWAKCWYVGVVTPLQDVKKNYPTKSEFKELEVGMGSFKNTVVGAGKFWMGRVIGGLGDVSSKKIFDVWCMWDAWMNLRLLTFLNLTCSLERVKLTIAHSTVNKSTRSSTWEFFKVLHVCRKCEGIYTLGWSSWCVVICWWFSGDFFFFVGLRRVRAFRECLHEETRTDHFAGGFADKHSKYQLQSKGFVAAEVGKPAVPQGSEGLAIVTGIHDSKRPVVWRTKFPTRPANRWKKQRGLGTCRRLGQMRSGLV